MIYGNMSYLLIETKAIPNYELKWKYKNFIMQVHSVAKLKYFLPTGEQDRKISNTHHSFVICVNYKANQEERIECIARSSIE